MNKLTEYLLEGFNTPSVWKYLPNSMKIVLYIFVTIFFFFFSFYHSVLFGGFQPFIYLCYSLLLFICAITLNYLTYHYLKDSRLVVFMSSFAIFCLIDMSLVFLKMFIVN